MPISLKFALPVAALALLGLAAAKPAQATLLVYEPFSYAPGNLAGSGPALGLGAWHDGSNLITAGSLTYTDTNANVLPVAGNKATTVGNNSGTFASLAPANLAALDGTQTYFTSFLVSNTGTVADSYAGISFYSGNDEKLFSGSLNNNNSYGIQEGGSGQASFGVASNTTTTHLLVTEYQALGGGKANVLLFADPVLGQTATPIASASFNNSNAFAATQLRIQSGGANAFNFDEVRIGTTYADVTPAPAVPEASSSIALGLMLSLGGVLLCARKRIARKSTSS